MSKLTATEVKALKPREKSYRIADGNGLSLQVNPNGSKWWRFRYRFDSKAKMISLGTYPDVTLANAREKLSTARNLVANDTDPGVKRKEKKVQIIKEKLETEFTFEVLARGILKQRLNGDDIKESHYDRTVTALENDAFPLVGNMEVKDIKPTDIKRVIRSISKRGANDSARKMYHTLNKIFKTIATRSDEDEPEFNYQVEISPVVSIDINDLVGKGNTKHYPVITDRKQLAKLLSDIDSYSGHYTTKMAMKVLPYVFLRSQNIRHLEWTEVDFKESLIRITASKMKTPNDFIIPMAKQLTELLEEVYRLTGSGRYVFPSSFNPNSPMSNNTMIQAFHRIGYYGNTRDGITKPLFVPHSWRAIFSTIANENGQKFEAIETQLAHSVGSKVSKSYNRALYLEDRKDLMQWWANWLDETREIK